MKILLDENLPEELRNHLPDHDVYTVRYMGWKGVTNGRLLDLAEQQFDAILTIDRNMSFQQNLGTRKLGVVLLSAPDNQEVTLIPLMPAVLSVLETLKPGQLVRVRGPVNGTRAY